MNRRLFLSMGSLGAVRFGAPPPQTATRARMHVGTQRGPTNDERLMYFKRHGVDNICGYPPADGENADWSVDVLARFRDQCASYGVSLDMVQFPFMSSSHVDRAQRKGIMLGREPERQREIDEACGIIRNCAAAGIPAVKYNLSLIGVLRTESTPGRGGTAYSTWRLAEALQEQRPLTRAGRVSAEEMWERITYFLERVVPVAEEYRIRIACHPQDPGVPPEGFTGVARVLGTVDGMKRLIAIHESPYHGLNLCLGATAEMLQDPAHEIKDVIRYFGRRKKIFNIHFRNIRGKRDEFQEVFPDEGDMDMLEVMRTLNEVDYPYMVMPDHLPRHPDDPGGRQAFAFGYGYIKALIQAVQWRCCTALAESEIRLWWWPRYVSSMKYPKRCQYKHAKQKKYHVRNWAEYNEGLRRRGDLTVWFDEEAIANWKADKTGKPGGQRVYSDMAIETGLVVRMVYKLAYRQTEGFLHSIASLLGLGIEIPDYSTLCRRSRLLRKKLRIPKAASTQPIHLMIDSTGLRIHVGNARKPPKQRAWRKLHIAVDRETGNIVASELTASRARDATRVPALLTQIQAPLVSVAADSAYDKEAVYEAIEAHSPGRRTRVVIPPQRNATLSQNSNTAMQERDRHIRAIERHGRREWYKLSGYTKRSMVENAVYRYKAIIGPEMRARTLARQRVEHRIGCEILNKMAALGMPDTYCAG